MNYRIVVVALLLIGSLPGGAVGFDGGHDDRSVAERTPAPTVGEPAEPSLQDRTTEATRASAEPNAVRNTRSATGSADVLHRTTILRHLPERAGTFETEMRFTVPESVTELEITLDAEATVVETDGFESTGGDTYRWTGDGDQPTVRYTMPANRTGRERHHESSETLPAAQSTAGYTFVDTGDWGVVQVPTISTSLRYTEPVGFDETVTVDGPGAAGSDIAFFGDVREHERTVDGETIRLAVPSVVDMREEPADVLERLAAASESLEVGSTHDEVFFVAVPSDVDWTARGIQYGETDAWVVADAPLDRSSNVWFHEYVHVRQAYANPGIGTASESTWLVEGQAEYYAAALALEQELIGFNEFSRFLERGERSPYADGVLAEPSTWRDGRTDYVKGPLVSGELDRQLRLATDGDRTLADVFRLLNAQDERVTEHTFLEAVEETGGSDVRAVAEQYTRTGETPTMWSRSDHATAFDRRRTPFTTGLGESLEVAGTAWDHPDDTTGPVTVPVGEPVTVPVAVENVGDRTSTVDATVQVDGTVVGHERVSLEAGARTTASFAWTPSEPGEYTVRAGGDRFTVLVRGPSSVRVTDLAVDPERVDHGEPVTATATVTAADSQPGAAVLEFRTGDGVVAERPVTVTPGERTPVETTLTFGDEGRHEVAVADQSAIVTVGDERPSIEQVPGFGAPAAAVALVATALLVRGRRLRRER